MLISSTVQSQVKAISENLESVLDFAMLKFKGVLILLSQSQISVTSFRKYEATKG